MAFEKRTEWGTPSEPDNSEYDLVVVGAGVSGLAAAFFYREQHPGARVLLLENHDDFGGHAKRNEFEWNGRTILGYGGSQSIEAPSAHSDVAKGLLSRLAVDTEALRAGYDTDFYRRHDLQPAVYFDREHYGVDRLVRTNLIDPSLSLPAARADNPATDIEAITVNRWPHGYAFTPNPLFDPDYGEGEKPYEVGRGRFGRIAIANSDAGGQAYLDCAIDDAWRAVGELSG